MSIDNRTVRLISLGVTDYDSVWNQQKDLQQKLIAQQGCQTLITCQHTPVITVGKSAKQSNILHDKDFLQSHGIQLQNIERGGDVTFHGPGQLVAYPILNLNFFKRDVGWYMRQLEQTVIQTAAYFGVKTQRIDGRTGVWIIPNQNDSVYMGSGTNPPRKLASIGVRLSRWCTMHGVGFNITSNLDGFNFINPCGFTDIKMTSLQDELNGSPENLKLFEEVQSKWIEQFAEVFEISII